MYRWIRYIDGEEASKWCSSNGRTYTVGVVHDGTICLDGESGLSAKDIREVGQMLIEAADKAEKITPL